MKKIFALDLGTTKFCLGYLQTFNRGVKNSIDTCSVISKGMNRGMISDFYAAQKSLNSLIDSAEKEFNTRINEVSLGVSGTHLRSRFITEKLPLDNEQIIKPRTLDKLKEHIHYNHLSENREIIHISPCSYQVDDREWTINPVGFSGTHLSSKFFIIDADKFYLSDLVRLCNSCGLKVKRLVSEQFASSLVTLDSHKKNLGVTLLDIGGGTSDAIVFVNGKPSKVFTINIGGNLVSKDLAIGLGVPFDEAERIKTIIGLSTNSSKTSLEIRNINGEIVELELEKMHQIIKARILELSNLVQKEISTLPPLLQGGILLTGGGSELKNIADIFQKNLKIPTQSIDPDSFEDFFISTDGRKLSSKLATVLGLLYHEYTLEKLKTTPLKTTLIGNSISKIMNWVKDLY